MNSGFAGIILTIICLIIFSPNSEGGQPSALILAEQQLQYIEQASDTDLLQDEHLDRPYLSSETRAKYYEKGLLKSNKFINLKFNKIPRAHLKRLRSQAYKTYSDETNSLPRRQAAFQFLCDTMVPGTSRTVVDKYLTWDTQSRISSKVFSLHLISPDGSNAWLTVTEDKVVGP